MSAPMMLVGHFMSSKFNQNIVKRTLLIGLNFTVKQSHSTCCRNKVVELNGHLTDTAKKRDRTFLFLRTYSTCFEARSKRGIPSPNQKYVLGIETSCDDTGAAIVDCDGNILGEALESQTYTHVQAGGIIPPVARDLHKKHIEDVVNRAMTNSGLDFMDIDAIATTTEPGLVMSLMVGLEFTRRLVTETRKPFIPVHHMEAHALTPRMIYNIDFPFMVLLISGGHCLLAVVRNVNDFILLGKGLDDAPGDAFDKVARELKLKHVPECHGLSGGASIELMAKSGNPLSFPSKPVMTSIPHCDFSFAGIKSSLKRLIRTEEEKQGLMGEEVLRNASDVCSSFQYMVLQHLAKRIQRGFLFCELHNLLPENGKTLVLSGGVASNQFLRDGITKMCSAYDCNLVCPPLKYCTDNGVMIAWNGMEKLKHGIPFLNPHNIDVKPKSPLGEDWTDRVLQSHLKISRRIKLL